MVSSNSRRLSAGLDRRRSASGPATVEVPTLAPSMVSRQGTSIFDGLVGPAVRQSSTSGG